MSHGDNWYVPELPEPKDKYTFYSSFTELKKYQHTPFLDALEKRKLEELRMSYKRLK